MIMDFFGFLPWGKTKVEDHQKPKLTVPEASALTPRLIEAYTLSEDNKVVENKGYIPVSLLKHAIEEKNIHNIAVAGNYGVGKSSVHCCPLKVVDVVKSMCVH